MESKKIIPLLIILILTASATLIATPASAVPNPSPPEFTVQYVDHSYDIPPTYGTDPYTGKTIITNYGSHVDNRTVDVTITNQPFTPYIDPNSNQTIYLYYNIRSKGHFDSWDTATSGHSMDGFQASNSGYTVVSFNIQYWNVPQGGEIDFQVKAITGFTYYNAQYCGTQYSTTVGDSGWSNTQTITIDNATPASPTIPPESTPYPTYNPYTPPVTSNPTATVSPPQNPTATPTRPDTQKAVLFGFDWEQTALLVLVVVIAILAVALKVVTTSRKVPAK